MALWWPGIENKNYCIILSIIIAEMVVVLDMEKKKSTIILRKLCAILFIFLIQGLEIMNVDQHLRLGLWTEWLSMDDKIFVF